MLGGGGGLFLFNTDRLENPSMNPLHCMVAIYDGVRRFLIGACGRKIALFEWYGARQSSVLLPRGSCSLTGC